MSPTNIRSGSDIIKRAASTYGSGSDELCRIAPENIVVYLDPRSCSAHELSRYSHLLNKISSSEGCWISSPQDTETCGQTTVSLPARHARPKAVLSPALSEFWRKPFKPIGEPDAVEPSDLIYLAIVQGVNGAAIMKLLTAHSRSDMGRSIFAELINGYSIVFTAACFEAEYSRRLDGEVHWERVESFKALQELTDKGKTQSKSPLIIGVLC